MRVRSDLMPEEIDFRTLDNPPTPGQGRYWLDRYLSERGDANIRSTGDLLEKANFYDDPNFPDHRARHERALEEHELDMVARVQNRFAVQTMVMAAWPSSSSTRSSNPQQGIVRLSVQVAQWADEQPDTELSRLPIPV